MSLLHPRSPLSSPLFLLGRAHSWVGAHDDLREYIGKEASEWALIETAPFFFPFRRSSGAGHLALRQAQYPSGDPSSGSKPALALLLREAAWMRELSGAVCNPRV